LPLPSQNETYMKISSIHTNMRKIAERIKKACEPFIRKMEAQPLFFMLPLLAALYLAIVPSKMEFSDATLTRNGMVENIALPYLANMNKDEVFYISFNLSVKDKKAAKFKIVPDDSILEIQINGKRFPLAGIEGLGNWQHGADFDFSKYVREGLNIFELEIMNKNGAAGLSVEMPYNSFRSLSLMQNVFLLLFLLFIVLVLRRQHYAELSWETIFACALSFPFVLHAFMEFLIVMNHELSGVSSPFDTPIYYALGRGLLNGIAPWTGLWETKPPGVFLASAISFK